MATKRVQPRRKAVQFGKRFERNVAADSEFDKQKDEAACRRIIHMPVRPARNGICEFLKGHANALAWSLAQLVQL